MMDDDDDDDVRQVARPVAGGGAWANYFNVRPVYERAARRFDATR